MHLLNIEQELIISLEQREFPVVKKFLESLDLRNGNEEVLQFWFEEGVWNVKSENREHIIVIFGKERMTLFLKKNDKFEQLKEKFFRLIDSKSK